jgi:glycosyltransferase involved in cell wall biosynthesis
MKRVLLIAYHYPPVLGSSGVHRTLQFSRHLPAYGWQPAVLTVDPRAYRARSQDQVASIPAGVEVERAFALDTERHLSIRGRYPAWLALPDQWWTWRFAAVSRGLRLIRRFQPHALWSTFPIATAHRIGLSLHRRTGLPWVADFRDAMTEPGYPSPPIRWRSQRRLEEEAVGSCARAVFTTEGALRMYADRYPAIPADRWAVIANGYDEEDFQQAEAEAARRPAREPGGPVTLVHSGIVYPEERDPRAFFAALSRLKRAGVVSAQRLRIVLRGTGHDAHHAQLVAENDIGDLVSLEPSLPYTEALVEMLTTDALLLLQASMCNHQIPAKVYEYVRARRPVFALTDPAGNTAETLREAGLGPIVPLDSADAIAEALPRFLDDFEAGRAIHARDDAVIACSRHGRSGELARLLDLVSG